jgi:hypothetical protein
MIESAPSKNRVGIVAGALTREDFTEARVDAFAKIAERAGFLVTTQAERDASLAAVLA